MDDTLAVFKLHEFTRKRRVAMLFNVIVQRKWGTGSLQLPGHRIQGRYAYPCRHQQEAFSLVQRKQIAR